jgi:hypothetical protein
MGASSFKTFATFVPTAAAVKKNFWSSPRAISESSTLFCYLNCPPTLEAAGLKESSNSLTI